MEEAEVVILTCVPRVNMNVAPRDIDACKSLPFRQDMEIISKTSRLDKEAFSVNVRKTKLSRTQPGWNSNLEP